MRSEPAAPAPAAACIIGGDGGTTTLRVVLPADAAVHRLEATAFAHVYETLVRIDCEGRVVAALADAWSPADGGTTWTLRLRPGAHFADGTPVDAADVLQSWSDAAARGGGGALRHATIAAEGARTVRVTFPEPVHDASLFAARALAVARTRPAPHSPVGSGPYTIDGAGSPVTLTPAMAASGNEHAPLEFSTRTDARHALDAAADVVITADAAAIAYARSLPAYAEHPLPFDRSYVLVAHAGRVTDTPSLPSPDALRALAHDVSATHTRAPELPAWWQAPCRGTAAALPGDGPLPARIVYPRDDVLARAVAERLAALAWPTSRAPLWLRAAFPSGDSGGRAPAAVGLDDAALAAALRSGQMLAAVVPLPRAPGAGAHACAAARSSDAMVRAVLDSPLRITPLLDARDHLLYRRGGAPITIFADGIRFPGGWP